VTTPNDHAAQGDGAHGIPVANDLWNQYDFQARWQMLAGATTEATGSLFGMAAPTVVANTPANADDAIGPWLNLPTTGVNNNAGGLTTAFNLYRATWLPNVSFRTKFGADTTSQRVWIGMASAAQTGTGTGTGHVAAFRYDTGQGDNRLKCVTRDNTTTTVTEPSTPILVTNDLVVSLGVMAEGVPGQAPQAWRFYVNRVMVARVTATLPVSATTNLGIIHSVTTLTGAIRSVRCGLISAMYQAR
jgi:hypothetical protein